MLHFVQRLLSDKAVVLGIIINSVKNNLFISTSMSYLYLYVSLMLFEIIIDNPAFENPKKRKN